MPRRTDHDDHIDNPYRAVADAMDGDGRARAFLADYVLGKPRQGVQHDGLVQLEYVDGDESDQVDNAGDADNG